MPVAEGGTYRTPQVSGATTLRIKAGGNVNDDVGGSGAREITLEGLDASGSMIIDTLITNGVSASSVSSKSFLRVYRVFVSLSGTYATVSTGSHSADIVIENGSGGTDWATIHATGFPHSQSLIAVYSVPLGSTAFVDNIEVWVESTKIVDVIFFKRENILQTAAPYTAMRVQAEFTSVGGQESIDPHHPLGPFNELTDIGFMAKGASTPAVSIHFLIMLVKNEN